MRLLNPQYVSPLEQWIIDHRAELKTYLDLNSDDQWISFDTIRADFPQVADKLTFLDAPLSCYCHIIFHRA